MKRHEYLSIESDTSMNPGLAFSQAVQLLDLAGSIATESKDVDKMLNVSTRWLDMGERFAEIGVGDDDDEIEIETKEKIPYGFAAGIEKQIIGKEVEDGTDDS